MIKSPPSKIGLGIIFGYGWVSLSIPINYPYGFFDSLVPVLIGMAITTFLLSDVHAQQQVNLINVKKKNPRHTLLFIARAFVALAIASPIHLVSEKTLFLALFIGTCFLLFFDAQLNYYRNKPLLNVGRTAVSDKVLRFLFPVNNNVGLILVIFFKTLLITGSIYLYLR